MPHSGRAIRLVILQDSGAIVLDVAAIEPTFVSVYGHKSSKTADAERHFYRSIIAHKVRIAIEDEELLGQQRQCFSDRPRRTQRLRTVERIFKRDPDV